MREVICVVKSPQSVLHVNDKIRVVNHPSGILGCDYKIKMIQMQIHEIAIGPQEIEEISLT